MSEDSNLPSAIRDSDAVDDNSTIGPLSGRSSPGTGGNQNNPSRIEVLDQKLEKQAKVIANIMEAFESLQKSYVERMENVESDLKNTKEELKSTKDELVICKEENDSVKKQLIKKDSEILELKKKMQSMEENFVKRFESAQKGIQEQSKQSTVCFSAKVEPSLHNIAPGTNVLVFRGVHTNIGNGYNSSNGEFTAPVGGHYVFYSNIFPQGGRSVETVLQVNGANRQSICGGPKLHQGGSLMVIHLNVGEKVKVTNQGSWAPIETANFYCNYHGSSFSGFLLSPDK